MAVHELVTDWSTATGRQAQSIMFFRMGTTPLEDITEALHDFWTGLSTFLDNNTRATIRPAGSTLDAETGELIGEWSAPALPVVIGTVAGATVPDPAQMLVRWGTDRIVNGRRLRGRTFVPGLSSLNTSEGQVSVSTQAGVTIAINGLIAADVGFSIWHRPVAGAGGSIETVTNGNVWNEFAVIRRRRG